MKALHVSLKTVYPKIDGGCVAIADFLTVISTIYKQVDHIFIATPKHPFVQGTYQKEMPENANVLRYFDIDTTVNYWRLLTSFGKYMPYQVSRFYSKEMANYLEEIAANYDAVILESAFLLPYLKHLKTAKKVIVRAHNVEFKVWETLAKTSTSWKSRIYSKISQQFKHYELAELEKVDGVILISEEDQAYFTKVLENSALTTIPLAIHAAQITPPKAEILANFGFLGSANWQPNKQAIHYLQKELFPAIQSEITTATLTIAGFGTDKIEAFHPSVEILGAVDKIEEFYQKTAIVLVPLTSGSGLKIKVVEAIVQGKVVIGSPIAFEGLEFLPNLRIAQTPAEYLVHIREVLQSATIFDEITTQQSLIYSKFGYESLVLKLKNFVS